MINANLTLSFEGDGIRVENENFPTLGSLFIKSGFYIIDLDGAQFLISSGDAIILMVN